MDGLSAIIRTFTTAYTAGGKDVNYNWQSPPYGSDSAIYGTDRYYKSNTYYFSGNKKLSTYTTDYNTAKNGTFLKAWGYPQYVRYDTSNSKISVTDIPDGTKESTYINTIVNNFVSNEVYIGKSSNTPDITISWNSKKEDATWTSSTTATNGMYTLRHKDINTNTSGLYVNINDTYISKSVLDKLVERYNSSEYKDSTGEYIKVRLSFGLHATKNNVGLMKTGYDAMDSMWGSWDPANYGYGDWNLKTVKVGTSALNYYDNWLYIPLAKFNNRTVEIRYKMRNPNDSNWTTIKTTTAKLDANSKTFTKESINSIQAAINAGMSDSHYIGGKLAKGTTIAAAEKNIANSSNSWGWGTNSFTIGASNNEEHYVVELYYDYRNVHERHYKLDGTSINSSWNKTYKKYTTDSLSLNAKGTSFYSGGNKYVYVKTNENGTDTTNKNVTVKALDGKNKLIFGGNYYVKFYYEAQGTRRVSVRHFVFNDNTGKYERINALTNSKAAIKDGEEGKYYLRPNGYSQRKYKAGYSTPTNEITGNFNQQYTVDYGDTIKLEKSWTIENSGIIYEYKGYKKQNAAAPTVLTTKAQANSLTKDTTVTIAPESVTLTYVDFYYTKKSVPTPGGDPTDPEAPTIDFVPQDDSGNEIGPDSASQTGDCRIAYVPSGENLKAYMTAVTFRPYSLIYDGTGINQTTGAVTYSLKEYQAYKLIGGEIKNNNSSKYGYINSTGKEGVFNTNSNTIVNPSATTINTLVQDSRNYYRNLNPNNITTVSDGRKTVKADFGSSNVYKVNYDKYNGVRKSTGLANYNITSLVSNGSDVFNVVQNKVSVNTKDDAQVNVYTPATIDKLEIEAANIVNHSNQDVTFVIQKNSEFKVKPVAGKTTEYNNINDTSKYIKYYYLVMDFDVKLLENQSVFDKDSNQIVNKNTGEILKAGTLIKINKGQTFRAIATNEDETGDIINQYSNKIRAIAVTWNVTDDSFEKKILSTIKATTSSSYVDKNQISKISTTCEGESIRQSHKAVTDVGGVKVTQMYDDAHYFVEKTENSKNIGRVYDFKITDCLDVDLKNIFRKSDTGTVNDLRGIQYFSGLRRLLVYNTGDGIQLGANQSNKNNLFDDRAKYNPNINDVVTKTILPLGPYKHIDTNYVQAPKLGYRFAFDLKTSGTYKKSTLSNAPVRYIKITPSYYYISKDGKTFNKNIDLYYKNSAGRYVNFEGSGYTIYFKPNDGYRTTYNKEASNIKDMSTKLEALKIGGTSTDKSFKITDNMMSYDDNNFVQAWYGEFKLPNSTIVVEKGGNINNPLIDGYVGVIFNIECVDKENASASESDSKVTTIISYNQNDKSAGGSSKNTSQWDYEGYLGFSTSNIGKDLSGVLRIQLEKGFWEIKNQTEYNNMKGTVVLYDLDNRAAEDFD